MITNVAAFLGPSSATPECVGYASRLMWSARGFYCAGRRHLAISRSRTLLSALHPSHLGAAFWIWRGITRPSAGSLFVRQARLADKLEYPLTRCMGFEGENVRITRTDQKSNHLAVVGFFMRPCFSRVLVLGGGFWLPIEIDLSPSYEHFASTYAVGFKALPASCCVCRASAPAQSE